MPVPTAVKAVEIALTDGSRIRMPIVETKKLSQIMLEMRATATTSSGTKAITKETLEHIFHGEVNKKGNAVGFHSDIGEMQAINRTKSDKNC